MMIGFFRNVAEAVLEVGVRGLLSEVPFGKFICDVAERVAQKEKDRRSRADQRAEFEQVVTLSYEAARSEARAAIDQVVRAGGVPLPESEANAVAEWMAGVPEGARILNRRPEDPAGTTLSAAFALDSATDVLAVLPPRPPRFQAGSPVPGRDGEWVLDRTLGVGGFGEVWLARHASGYYEPRAVKFYFDETGRDVVREAELVKRAVAAGRGGGDDDSRRHIVPILDVRLTGDAPWLMFEYVGGGNLTDWLVRLAGKPAATRVPQVVTALRQLCRGAGVFHRLPVPLAHRDLKPSNILFDRTTRRLRITDFGIGAVTQRAANAREERGETSRGERLVSYLRGSFTPTYSSPEQRAGADADPRDDVHALGVIGYQLLVGDLASAPGVDLAEDLRDAGTPPELIEVVAACVARKRDRRPADAVALAARLESVGDTAAPRPPAAPKSPPIPTAPVPAAGAERRVIVAGNIGMTFCWIPPGSCQLGAPPAELEAARVAGVKAARAVSNAEPDYSLESEAHRGKFTTPGFWLAKYQVTQGEWAAIMRGTPLAEPSLFRAGAKYADKVAGLSTDRSPVDSVSWEDCVQLLALLNQAGATFRLPHENEWEYAYRGGLGNKQAFYWGATLNGREANIYGGEPFGTTEGGPFLDRPVPVEFASGGRYPTHPWGLHHMSGNVNEWCDNQFEQEQWKVLRGGSFATFAYACRGAARSRRPAGERSVAHGCRLLMAQEPPTR